MLTRRKWLAALGVPVLLRAQKEEPPRFSITGHVERPGVYELKEGMRVADAIQMAGGFTDFANIKNISVVRGNERHHFNYRAYLRRERLEENILLEKNDVIAVP